MQAIIDNIIWAYLIIVAAAIIILIIYLPFRIIEEIKLKKEYKARPGDPWWLIWQKYEKELFIKNKVIKNWEYPFQKTILGKTFYTRRFIKNFGRVPTDEEYKEIATLYSEYKDLYELYTQDMDIIFSSIYKENSTYDKERFEKIYKYGTLMLEDYTVHSSTLSIPSSNTEKNNIGGGQVC